MTDAPGPVRRCPVCEHPSVLAINAALLNGKSYSAIARDFKIGSERSGTFKPDHKKVTRHAEGCMATSFQKVQDSSLTAQGHAIQARLRELDSHVDTAIRDALEGHVLMSGDAPLLDDDGKPQRERTTQHLRVLLAAVREGRHNQALIAKLAGALPEGDDPAEAMRELLKDPAMRKLVTAMEERAADLEKAAGNDTVS